VTKGCGVGVPQSGEPSHAAKMSPSELEIRFTDPVRLVVAKTALETAWFSLGGKRVRVIRAEQATMATETSTTLDGSRPMPMSPGDVVRTSRDGVEVLCADGVVRLRTVQPEGKSPMAAFDWANGARLPASLA
jgi:methionyl-tRNA formyltransferase